MEATRTIKVGLVCCGMILGLALALLAVSLVPSLPVTICEPPPLHSYQQWDASRCIYSLRPGFVAQPEGNVGPDMRERAGTDDARIAINSSGYRGPEVDHAHSKPRILAIGDSCTFGTWFGGHSYPRAIERELGGRACPVEVINAGVEGYSTGDVEKRLEEFASLRPEVTTIYIGWNDLFGDASAVRQSSAVQLLNGVKRRVEGEKKYARDAIHAERRPNRDDPTLAGIDHWQPRFESRLAEIAARAADFSGRAYLVTLPGLYRADEDPSPRALEIGHLPTFTRNPLVLAKMTERYNAEVRSLAERNGLGLIDLERWAQTALKPADHWFFDSVHLYPDGQEKVGAYMASILEPAACGTMSKGN